MRRRLLLALPLLLVALAAPSASAGGGVTDNPAFKQVQGAACYGYGGQPPVLCDL